MAILKNFFGCYRLENGGIVIGWLEIVTSPLLMVALLIMSNLQFWGIALVILLLFKIFVAIVLLIGIERTTPSLIFPWLIINFKTYIAAILYGMFALINMLNCPKDYLFTGVESAICFLFIIFVGYCVYSWLLVFSICQYFYALRSGTLINSNLSVNDSPNELIAVP